MKPVWLIALLVMNVLWAAAYPLFQQLAPVLSAGTLATTRFGLAAAIIVAGWRWLPGRAPEGFALLRVMVMGVIVFCAAPRLQVLGVQRGNAGDAAILMAFDPVIVSLAAAIFLREHIPGRTWLGCLLGAFGVAFLAEFWTAHFRWSALSSYFLVLGSFVCESAYSVVGKPLLARAHPVKVLACAIVAGSVVNLAIDGLAVTRALPALGPAAWGAMAYLVLVCTVIGYALWFYAVREMPINLVAVTVFLQPPAGVLFDLWLNDVRPRWSQLGGTACIAVGLLVTLRRGSDATPPLLPSPVGTVADPLTDNAADNTRRPQSAPRS